MSICSISGQFDLKIPFESSITEKIVHLSKMSPSRETGGVIRRVDVASRDDNRGAVDVVQIHNSCSDDNGYIPNWNLLALVEDSDPNDILAHWHSHVNGRVEFSSQDLNSMYQLNKPSIIYDVQNDRWNYRSPRNDAPYLGRSWEYAWMDCYTIIRDFYWREFQIWLPAPYHSGTDQPWLQPDFNEPLEKLPGHFNRQSDSAKIKPYDVLLFHGRISNPSHLGMALRTHQGLQLLHHPFNRYSELTARTISSEIHSIWRIDPCRISTSNYSAYWAIGSGEPTNFQSIDLVRV